VIIFNGQPGQTSSTVLNHRILQIGLAALLVVIVCVPVHGESFDAFLEPYQTVEISAPFRDRLDAVHVKDGQSVAAGELLAQLSSKVLFAQHALAREAAASQGAIESARAMVAMRSNRLTALKELEKSGNVRPLEMISAETELRIARAQLQSALEGQQLKELEVAVIEAQIEEKKLRSPIAGVVVKVNRNPAELVGGIDQQALLTVVQLDPLKAVFHLPEHHAGGLSPGTAVILDSGRLSISAELEYISPVINAQSGTVEVRVRISNQEQKLISGSRCSLNIDK
jgi:RND family efflux transporter MFP subunit